MIIRQLEPQDAAQASRIYALSWKDAYRGIVPQEYLNTLPLDFWEPFLRKSARINFLLVEDGIPVGTSSVCPARDNGKKGWGEVISLYLLPQYQGRGFGKALLAHGIRELKRQGFNRLYLWVLEENRRARSFYESQGFSFQGETAVLEIGGKELTELRYVRTLGAE